MKNDIEQILNMFTLFMYVTNCATVIMKTICLCGGQNNSYLGLARFLVNSKTIFGVTSSERPPTDELFISLRVKRIM